MLDDEHGEPLLRFFVPAAHEEPGRLRDPRFVSGACIGGQSHAREPGQPRGRSQDDQEGDQEGDDARCCLVYQSLPSCQSIPGVADTDLAVGAGIRGEAVAASLGPLRGAREKESG